MEQYKRKIKGSKISIHKTGCKISKNANNTNAPKPSDIQKIIKKKLRKEGE